MKKNFDLLRNEFNGGKERRIKKLGKKLFYPLVFFAIFVVSLSFQVAISRQSVSQTISESIRSFSFLNSLGIAPNRNLKGFENDRINVLLLGMGGAGHDGPYLSDTMILASYKPSTNDVSMLSIPRDMAIPLSGYGWRKINLVNSIGEGLAKGKGGEYTTQILGDLFRQKIDYFVRVDFSGFEKLIDELGGIKIYVDTAFTDTQFPADNYAYQTVSFEQGWQQMNGEKALQYARSRHGSSGEGSDFGRSQRQQKVIKAVKDKILSINTLFNPKKISALFDAYKNNVSTNLEPWEMISWMKIGNKIKNENIQSVVLDDRPGSLLYATNINGAYLLLPKDDTFNELRFVTANIFEAAQAYDPAQIPTVEVYNGTNVEGLAYKTTLELKRWGYKVNSFGNAMDKDYEKTVIYDLTGGQKPYAMEKLRKLLNANVSEDVPAWLEIESKKEVTDYIIVLGESITLSRK